MTRWVPVGLLVAGMLAAGCRSFQVSVEPFFQATEAVAGVTGRWVSEGDDADELEFVPVGENEWRLASFDSTGAEGQEKGSGARVRFGRLDDALYWDMTAELPGSTGDLAKEHLIELHSVARVRLDGDTMEIAFLRPDWMSGQLADGRLDLAHFREDDKDHGDYDPVVLTAPTDELEAFLREHGGEAEAFTEPVVFHRVS